MEQSPQLEDGYTRLANDLLDALIGAGLTSRQWAIAMAIVRKTYGYNKKEDDIGLSQLSEMTGIAKAHVSVAVRELEARRIVTRKQGVFGHRLGINKRFTTWAEGVTKTVTGVTESVTPNDENRGYRIGNERVTESVTPPVTESVTTKDNPSKDNQKTVSRKGICFADWMEQLREAGEKAIPEDHAVFAYANKINLPIDFLRLCWLEFRREHADRKDKRQKDWPATFAVYVRKNYYRLWFKKNDEWQLTTAGIQLEEEMRDEK
ncbi:MAG TPA: replication protein [Noviherbaspirillum sp.]|nr:replication protein [Noviherbaspirillum sp.]